MAKAKESLTASKSGNKTKDSDKSNGKTVQSNGTSWSEKAESSDNGSSSQSSARGEKQQKKDSSNDGSFGSLVKGKNMRSKTTTSSGRKAVEREMKKRTSRLYNRLEEVKQRKLEKDRQEQYAVYRQKRKDFEQKLQNRLSKWANHKSDD